MYADNIITDEVITSFNKNNTIIVEDQSITINADGYLQGAIQDVAVNIGTTPQHYLLECLFRYDAVREMFDCSTQAYVDITVTYGDNTKSTYMFPLWGLLLSHTEYLDETWFVFSEKVEPKADSLISALDINIVNTEGSPSVHIAALTLRKSLNDVELHETNINPHNLPLSIGVGGFGIKAMKGEDVMFWLQDSGDALFAGELQAATGTFAGTVYAENIDTTNAKISVAQIEQLIVGENVTMGASATITWDNLEGKPDDLVTTTVLGQDYIITGKINADNIDTGTLTGVIINVTENVNIGKWLYLNPGTFNGGIRWGNTAGSPEIYVDPGSGAMFVEGGTDKDLHLNGTNVYINGTRADQIVAVFG